MQEVFDKIIEKLEDAKINVPVNRLLDDIIKDKPKELGQLMAYNKSIEIVKQEAEKYNNGWIPCSEKLPDDFMSFEYLTIRKGHTLATITYYCVANHKWYLSRNSSKEIDVIAWMELPSAYRPKEK